MTPKQCIKVAEKLWKWKHVGPSSVRLDTWLSPGSEPHLYHQSYSIDDLKREVNSWQGFGRTVEAMFDKDILFGMEFIIENRGRELAFRPNSKCKTYPVIWDGEDPNELIEATHLAALEAREKK